MFAKQLLTAALSRCIIQEFSYNVAVASHIKFIKQCLRLEPGERKQQKYYQAAHNTYVPYMDCAPCSYRATTDDPAVTLWEVTMAINKPGLSKNRRERGWWSERNNRLSNKCQRSLGDAVKETVPYGLAMAAVHRARTQNSRHDAKSVKISVPNAMYANYSSLTVSGE